MRTCEQCSRDFSYDTWTTDIKILSRLPVQSRECPHVFCRECAYKLASGACPSCGAPGGFPRSKPVIISLVTCAWLEAMAKSPTPTTQQRATPDRNFPPVKRTDSGLKRKRSEKAGETAALTNGQNPTVEPTTPGNSFNSATGPVRRIVRVRSGTAGEKRLAQGVSSGNWRQQNGSTFFSSNAQAAPSPCNNVFMANYTHHFPSPLTAPTSLGTPPPATLQRSHSIGSTNALPIPSGHTNLGYLFVNPDPNNLRPLDENIAVQFAGINEVNGCYQLLQHSNGGFHYRSAVHRCNGVAVQFVLYPTRDSLYSTSPTLWMLAAVPFGEQNPPTMDANHKAFLYTAQGPANLNFIPRNSWRCLEQGKDPAPKL